MLYALWSILALFWKFDYVVHCTQRLITTGKIANIGGQKLISWVNKQPKVIWAKNTPSNYLEDVMRSDFFKSNSSIL